MKKYPKTLHKKGGIFSTKLKGERVSYSVNRAIDEDHESELKKDGWCDGLEKAFEPELEQIPEPEPELEVKDKDKATNKPKSKTGTNN